LPGNAVMLPLPPSGFLIGRKTIIDRYNRNLWKNLPVLP